MKINNDFIIYDMGDEVTLVPTGAAADDYHGIVRCNSTAAFIINCLKDSTTKEEILEKLMQKYEGDKECMAASIEKTVETLRSINALEA